MRRSPFDPDCSVLPVGGKVAATKSVGTGLICVLLFGAASGCTAKETQSDPAPATQTASPDEIKKGPTIVRPELVRKTTMDEKNKRLKDPGSGTVEHSVPPEFMERLINAAAREAGLSADDVILEYAEDVTWRDGSLGCPQPDMAYTQALVEGYWVVLHAGGQEFDMRATRNGMFTRCQGSTKQPPSDMKTIRPS